MKPYPRVRHIRPEELPAGRLARDVLGTFTREARRLAGDRVERIVVYGSMARGDSGPESDLDIWVDWNGDEAEGRAILSTLGADLFVETGLIVSVHVVSAERRRRLEAWQTGFFRNVQAEGLVVEG